MNIFDHLVPEALWHYFEEILKIPRPSRKEDKIREYLVNFAKSQSLSWKTDKAGNLLISKPAAPGFEDRKIVILQSHLDMVGEKNSGIRHDFNSDPIIPQISGSWVKATGTTLGADDGIGIAAQLAILASDCVHGPLECLFTIDEETGLTGAKALEPGLIHGSILLNLDSEDEGELFIGCAGGVDTIISFNFKKNPVPAEHLSLEVSLNGLTGGHSGDDIHKGYGNSNKILARFLWESALEFNIQLHHIEGGNLRNAIPREARAIITVDQKLLSRLKEKIVSFEKIVRSEVRHTEPKLCFQYKDHPVPEFIINNEIQYALLNSLHACPNGVIEWSRDIPGLVETSSNLASIRCKDDLIFITTSQRSSLESAKINISNRIAANFLLAGAKVRHTDGYPGWEPNTDSEILKIASASYKKLFDKEPSIKAIHAGLECGLFLEKNPDLDMISFGPTIKGAHSPDERLEVKSTEKFWLLLLDILENIPQKK